ncbi:MAG: hypothetical protein ACREFR_08255, partial [Limisphaerales bacterium]
CTTLTDISRWKHTHDFTADFSAAEKNTRRVLILTAARMFAEIIFGLKVSGDLAALYYRSCSRDKNGDDEYRTLFWPSPGRSGATGATAGDV